MVWASSSHECPSPFPASSAVLAGFFCKAFPTTRSHGQLLVLDNCLEGVFVLFWLGYPPVLVMSDSRLCLPKRPAALIRRTGQRGKQKPPEVERARFQEIRLPMWQNPDIWEVNWGLTLSLHSPWHLGMKAGFLVKWWHWTKRYHM